MLPIVGGIIILLLIVIGIIGAFAFYKGTKLIQHKKRKSLAIGTLVFGCLCLSFVIYNWFGYQKIFTDNEVQIIGNYRSKTDNSIMKVYADNTWEIITNSTKTRKSGNWKYIMSEDWCYWNMESPDFRYRVQTGSSQIISFEEQNLKFVKID